MSDSATKTPPADTGFLVLESMASMQRVGDEDPAGFFEGGSTLVDLSGDVEARARSVAEQHRADLAAGQHVSDRYTVLGEIARGGMGAVLEVQDSDLDRRVAMKVLLRDARKRESDTGSTLDEGPVNRFIGEAQLTGNLEHPNIVPVHELGLDADGRVYFTMKRVKGRSLRQIMDKLRQGHAATLAEFSHGRLLSVLLKVCDAIEFAHSRNIIHRDLKPENIMVGQFGEVLVMDWGLAKQLDTDDENALPVAATRRFNLNVSLGAADDDSTATHEGTVSGTPAYMAPEQARGKITELSRLTDVFCLGAVLYEMLSLTPPYLASTMTEALEFARDHKLMPPKQKLEAVLRDPKLKRAFGEKGIERAKKHPRELVAIAMKAMSEDRYRRYNGVAEFKRDIENYLSAQPVTARRDGPWAALQKWARRNPTRATVISLVLMFALLGGAIIGGVYASAAAEQLRLAEENRLTEERERAEIQRRLEAEADARTQADLARERAEQVAELEQRNLEREQRQREALEARNNAFTPYSQGADLRNRSATFMDWRERATLWGQAAHYFRTALDYDPTFVEANVELALVYADLGFDDDALHHFLRADWLAEQAGRGHAEALMAYAMYDLQRRALRGELETMEMDEVLMRFHPVFRAAEPNSYFKRIAEVLVDLANEYRTLDGASFDASLVQASTRLARIQQETERHQPLWEVHTLLAFLDRTSSRERRAHLVRARELKPNLPLLVLLELEYGGRQSGSADRTAIGAWDRFISDFPYDPRGYFSRALARFNSRSERNHDLEIADLRRATELNPRYADAHKLLLRVYVRQGMDSTALSHIESMRRSQSGLSHGAITLIEAELTAATGNFARLEVLLSAAFQDSPTDGAGALMQAGRVLLQDHEYFALAEICRNLEFRLGDRTPPVVDLFLARSLTMLAEFNTALDIFRALQSMPATALPRELRETMRMWADDANDYPMLLESLSGHQSRRVQLDLARILAARGADPDLWLPMLNVAGMDPHEIAVLFYPADYVLRAQAKARLARSPRGSEHATIFRALAVAELKYALDEGYLNRKRILTDEFLAPLATDPSLADYFDVK